MDLWSIFTMLPATRSPLKFPVRVGNFVVSETILGKGNFAVVRLGTHVPTGEKVAVKVIQKNKLSPENLEKVYREITILKRLRHPGIIRLYYTMETPEYVFLVTEYAPNGEIFEYVIRKGRLKEDQARKIFRQVVMAVSHCHAHDVVHRDLKAENLLLDMQMGVKLADFGFSSIIAPGTLLTESCGSPPYAAPELFYNKSYDGIKCDVWSLAVLLPPCYPRWRKQFFGFGFNKATEAMKHFVSLERSFRAGKSTIDKSYVLICGALPFDGDTQEEIKRRVTSGKFRIPFFMSESCESLLRIMLVVDPIKRCSLAAVMNHPWITKGNDIPLSECPEEDYGFEDGELNEFVLDEMERLGYHRNFVRHMVMSDTYHDISATYHLLNDAFNRKLKSGDRALTTPIPISRDSSRRSSITTGVVDKEDLRHVRGITGGSFHATSTKLLSPGPGMEGSPRSPAYAGPRRGSLPQHIRFFQPSGSSTEDSSLAEANESEEVETPVVAKKTSFLQVPVNPMLEPFARRASEGMPCVPFARMPTPRIISSDSIRSPSSSSSSILPSQIHQLTLHDSSEIEPDSEAVHQYMTSRGNNQRHTISNVGAKLPSAQSPRTASHHRFSPVRRRHSEPQYLITAQQRALLEKIYNRAISPVDEMQHLQRQLDSGHASPFCHSPVSPMSGGYPWHSQQPLSPSFSPSVWHTQLSPTEAQKNAMHPKLLVTNEFGITRTGSHEERQFLTLLRPPGGIPRPHLRPLGSPAMHLQIPSIFRHKGDRE